MSKSKLKARSPRGFEDRLGVDIAAEDELIRRASGVFERWGFRRLETPAFEFTDALGKFLPDKDRPNDGVFSLTDDDDQWMSLRYDLTAPLARYVAQNSQTVGRPFRRWQAGPVWRNEKPGPGRFRQFTQCDADSVGVPGPAADAEMIMVACDALEAIGVPRGDYGLKINTRKALNAVLDAVVVTGSASVEDQAGIILRAIDKLDRLGLEGVADLLGKGRMDESGDYTEGAKLNAASVEKVLAFVQAGRGDGAATIAALEDVLGSGDNAKDAIAEMKAMAQLLEAAGYDGARADIDPSVVRGLDYYTGPVFEAQLNMTTPAGDPIAVGSVGGGGRYDDLVARFTGQSVPATGFSIGVSRLITALNAAERPLLAPPDGPVLILAFEEADMPDYFALAARVRSIGAPAEVYLGGAGMRAQMKYADRRGSPLVVMYGADEKAAGIVNLKDLREGAEQAKTITDNETWREERPGQFEVPVADLEAAVKMVLARGNPA
ncbi:MAG: histidine--tRNA ligase [Pseudomonadota bacterium]